MAKERLFIRKNKEAFARGRNPKTGTNNPLWKEWVKIEGKDYLLEIWPFNNKFGRQDLLINVSNNEKDGEIWDK
jgi:hypothetical protein